MNQILDKENQVKFLQEFQTGEYNRKLYSKIIKELNRKRLTGSGFIYYNYLIERIKQNIKNFNRNKYRN